MQKTTLFTILFSIIFMVQSFSQSLKLRLDYGVSIDYNSYHDRLFHHYDLNPISTPEFTVKTLPDFWVPFHFGILLEYDIKKRNHFSLGYMSDCIVESNMVKYNVGFMAKDSVIWVGQEGPLTKAEYL